jgi:hypothetical protein
MNHLRADMKATADKDVQCGEAHTAEEYLDIPQEIRNLEVHFAVDTGHTAGAGILDC